MSSSPFPDPITTNFIPEAWQWIDLWNKFRNFIVSYPTAQATINFAGPVYLTTRTALTQWANTAYATSEIVAWLATVNFGTLTSAVLQYYFGGVAVNTINPLTTGGTLLIGHGSVTNNVEVASVAGRSTVLHLGDGNSSTGGVHINNGTNTTGDVVILNGTGTITLGSATSTTSLSCPLTPLYNYPIGTSTGSDTPSIGTPGTIGFIPATTFITNTTNDGSGGGGISQRSVSLTPGNYLVYGFAKTAVSVAIFASSIMLTPTQNSSTGAFGQKGSQVVGSFNSTICMGLNTMFVIIVTTTTTYYLNVRSVGVGPTILFSQLLAVRMA